MKGPQVSNLTGKHALRLAFSLPPSALSRLAVTSPLLLCGAQEHCAKGRCGAVVQCANRNKQKKKKDDKSQFPVKTTRLVLNKWKKKWYLNKNFFRQRVRLNTFSTSKYTLRLALSLPSCLASTVAQKREKKILCKKKRKKSWNIFFLKKIKIIKLVDVASRQKKTAKFQRTVEWNYATSWCVYV